MSGLWPPPVLPKETFRLELEVLRPEKDPAQPPPVLPRVDELVVLE